MPLNIRIQWNAGTACVSECVLKKLACRGLRVGPSKPHYRGQNPQNREKRVSESKNPHFPPTPEKGVSSQNIPIFYTEQHRENGDFLTRNALFLGWEGGEVRLF